MLTMDCIYHSSQSPQVPSAFLHRVGFPFVTLRLHGIHIAHFLYVVIFPWRSNFFPPLVEHRKQTILLTLGIETQNKYPELGMMDL